MKTCNWYGWLHDNLQKAGVRPAFCARLARPCAASPRQRLGPSPARRSSPWASAWKRPFRPAAGGLVLCARSAPRRVTAAPAAWTGRQRAARHARPARGARPARRVPCPPLPPGCRGAADKALRAAAAVAGRSDLRALRPHPAEADARAAGRRRRSRSGSRFSARWARTKRPSLYAPDLRPSAPRRPSARAARRDADRACPPLAAREARGARRVSAVGPVS